MTIAQQLGQLHELKEFDDRRRDFAKVVRAIMLGRGDVMEATQLAHSDRGGERVELAIRAAQDPLSLGSVGAVLSPFQLLANAFMNSLASFGAFDAMLGSMMKLPLRSRIVSVTSTITGTSLSESDTKRVGQLSLGAADLTISKVVAIVAASEELLRAGGDGAAQFLERELRAAVAVATDTQFLALITAGAPSIPSSGSNATAARLDIRALLASVNPRAASRLFLITTPAIAAAWSTIGDASGAVAFPNAVWNGGSASNIPIVVTDGAQANTVVLADGSGIAANSEGLRVDGSKTAALQMDSAPDSPPTASTPVLSLWQQNLIAARVERFFGAKVVRANSVAQIVGANYTGSSP